MLTLICSLSIGDCFGKIKKKTINSTYLIKKEEGFEKWLQVFTFRKVINMSRLPRGICCQPIKILYKFTPSIDSMQTGASQESNKCLSHMLGKRKPRSNCRSIDYKIALLTDMKCRTESIWYRISGVSHLQQKGR